MVQNPTLLLLLLVYQLFNQLAPHSICIYPQTPTTIYIYMQRNFHCLQNEGIYRIKTSLIYVEKYWTNELYVLSKKRRRER